MMGTWDNGSCVYSISLVLSEHSSTLPSILPLLHFHFSLHLILLAVCVGDQVLALSEKWSMFL